MKKFPVFLALFLMSTVWADTYTDNGNGTVTLTVPPQAVAPQVIDPKILQVELSQLQLLDAKTQAQIAAIQAQINAIYIQVPTLQPVQAALSQGASLP